LYVGFLKQARLEWKIKFVLNARFLGFVGGEDVNCFGTAKRHNESTSIRDFFSSSYLSLPQSVTSLAPHAFRPRLPTSCFLQPDLSFDVSCCRYCLNRSTEKLLRLKQTAEKSSKSFMF
jgi:hypothetical protein